VGGLPLDGLPLDGETPPDGEDGETPPDKEKEKKFYIAKVGKVNKRLYDYYQGLLKRMEHEEAIKRVKLKQMEDEWAEKNLQTLTERFSEKGPFGVPLGPLGILKGALQKQPYENEFLGSAGAAAILNKINKAGTEGEKQKIMHDAIAANPEGFNDMFSDYTGVGGYEDLTPEDFKRVLTDYNAGNKNFDRVMDPDSYYALHPPQTTDEMERMLGSGITMTKENTKMIQDARDRVSESQGQGGGIGGLGGGGGALPPVTDPTQPTVPDYVLKQQYMPGFTPDYSGGAEQMQIAGGYWDPITKKWIGSPWGTQGQYQFNQGGIVGTNPLLFKNKGGMVNDGGIKSFKKYGY
jgi:hypothetical protein